MKNFNLHIIIEKFQAMRHGEYRTISAKAHHDWKIMVMSFTVLVGITITINIYLFLQINSGTSLGGGQTVATSTGVVSKKNLEETVQFFQERKARLEDLKTIKPDVVDPSM